MGRAFHVCCMGPIDPEWVDAQSVAAMFAKVGVPKAAPRAMEASLASPCRLGVEGGSLAAAKKLDAELLKVGLLSQIYFVESGGDGKEQVYVDGRQAQRRAEAASREQRADPGEARRGRRAGDKA